MRRRTLMAAVFDLAAVLVFVAIGRRNHDEDPGVSGLLSTAAPFLLALVIGWLALRAWRHPLALRTGAEIWVFTVIGGMLLRRIDGDGTALSFVIVAALFLGVTIVGWRLIALGLTRRRRTTVTSVGTPV